MRVSYPNAQSRQLYERNAIYRNVVASTGATGPHATTQRITYTVPANRRALITSCYGQMQRATVAAPVGAFGVFVIPTVNTVGGKAGGVMSVSNVVGDGASMNYPIGLYLNAGDSIELDTYDLGTGGTVAYWVQFAYMEFDA